MFEVWEILFAGKPRQKNWRKEKNALSPFHAAMARLQDYSGRTHFALITDDYPALTVTRRGAKPFTLKGIRKCHFGIRITLS